MSDQPKSDDDAFAEAMADVDRLKHDGTEPYKHRRRPIPLPKEADGEDDDFVDLAIDTPEFLEFRRPGIQNRLFRDLQRGLIDPQATIDLHGMRVVDARRALSAFLAQALRGGKRCVRVIHGKGRRSDNTEPVLKQKTNQWLQHRKEVLAFCSAPRWDGGTGAAYVLLKRHWPHR